MSLFVFLLLFFGPPMILFTASEVIMARAGLSNTSNTSGIDRVELF
jgi:hypothetical protein